MATFSWDKRLEWLMNALTEAREIARIRGNGSGVRKDLNAIRAYIGIYIRTGRVDERLVSDCISRLREDGSLENER